MEPQVTMVTQLIGQVALVYTVEVRNKVVQKLRCLTDR